MDFSVPDIVNLIYDMIFIIDKKGNIRFANKASEENLFYTAEEFVNMNLNEILFESDKFIEILDSIITSALDNNDKSKDRFSDSQVDLSIIKKEIGYQDLILISKDTNLKIMMANFQARKLNIEKSEYFLLILHDITERKFFEQELFKITENLELLVQEKTLELQKKNVMLEKLATRDTLTNLLNIRKFREILTSVLQETSKSGAADNEKTTSLVMIDADHFKYYNDTFGHQVGDEIIKNIGKILARSVKRDDYVARYGGDEFIILFPKITYKDSVAACMRIMESVKQQLIVENIVKDTLDMDAKVNNEHKITLSIGLARYEKGKTMDDLINDADSALYRSKESGRNCVHILNPKGEFIRLDT